MSNKTSSDHAAEIGRLTRELEEAELYEQKLHDLIIAIRNELAAGHPARALSMCNQTLNEIDSATDVVASSGASKGAG